MDARYAYSGLQGRLISILSDVLQIELGPEIADMSRKEIDGWDSVNHLRFILELEELFGISISDEETADVSSLSQAEKLLLSRGITLQPEEIK
jgi:acyl carrier protein